MANPAKGKSSRRKAHVAAGEKSASAPQVVGPLLFDLTLPGALSGRGGPDNWHRHVYVSFCMRDGKAEGGRIGPQDKGWTIAGWTGVVDSLDITFARGRLSGSIRATVSSNELEAGAYTFTLDGKVRSGAIAGDFAAEVNGKAAGRGAFMGTLKPGTFAEPDPEDGVYTLVLDRALDGRETLAVYLDRKPGEFQAGCAIAPTFNRTFHGVDATGLRVEGGALKGDLKVVVHPDAYVPADHRPVPCVFALDAALVKTGLLRGRYAGVFGTRTVAGTASGELTGRRQPAGPAKIWMKLTNALLGADEWRNRAWISFVFKDGQACDGTIGNSKKEICGWKGKVESMAIEFSGERLVGVVEATVESDGAVAPGRYTFALDGRAIGPVLAGVAGTRLGGSPPQSCRFIGGVGE